MSDTIDPALTAEEWARFRRVIREAKHETKYEPEMPTETEEAERQFCVAWNAGAADANPDMAPRKVNLHRAAAYALYGQPFGFTGEDVKCLRWALAYIETPCHSNSRELPPFPPLRGGGCVELERLAAKIAALLPPAMTDPSP